MATKRMFNKKITDTDMFIDMPASAQILYFHLNMHADDDGFISNTKQIMRMIGSCEDDLKILFGKQFLIPFESGVCVIKHWKIHNYIKKDRYSKTIYSDEMGMIEEDEHKMYTKRIQECTQDGYKPDTQIRLDKNSIRLDKNRVRIEEKEGKNPSPPRHKHGRYKRVLLTDDEYQKVQDEDLNVYLENLDEYIEMKGDKYKSHIATMRAWKRKDEPKAQPKKGRARRTVGP